MRRRLSIYIWNPGPRRVKEDAFEQQSAGKWHIITLQGASEYVYHELLTNRFHVRLRDSLQQGHIPPQYRRQIHVPS